MARASISSFNPHVLTEDQVRQVGLRVFLYQHSIKCQFCPQCEYGDDCQQMKELASHLSVCTGAPCGVQDCSLMRVFISHYNQCVDETCPVCPGVRDLLVEEQSVRDSGYESVRSYSVPQVNPQQQQQQQDQQQQPQNLYEILQVTQDATPAQIRKSYLRLAVQLHPDKNKAPDAQGQFTQLAKAYEILSDADKRQIYDRTGNYAEDAMNQHGEETFLERARRLYRDILLVDEEGPEDFNIRRMSSSMPFPDGGSVERRLSESMDLMGFDALKQQQGFEGFGEQGSADVDGGGSGMMQSASHDNLASARFAGHSEPAFRSRYHSWAPQGQSHQHAQSLPLFESGTRRTTELIQIREDEEPVTVVRHSSTVLRGNAAIIATQTHINGQVYNDVEVRDVNTGQLLDPTGT